MTATPIDYIWLRVLEHELGLPPRRRGFRADELWYWHLTDEEIAGFVAGEEGG